MASVDRTPRPADVVTHPVGDPPSSLTATRHLDRALASGIAWTAGTKWVVQLLTWTSTLVLARLLALGDFGLFGMATVYLGLVELVNEFGLGTAIVQRRELDSIQIGQLGGLAVGLGGLFCLLSVATAGVIAGFFGEPAVRKILMVLSVTFVTSALQVVPRALLGRDLRFRRLALLDAVEGVVQSVGTMALAFAGLGYWSLVIGAVASRVTATVLVNFWRPHRIALPVNYQGIASSVTFGWHLVVSRVAWYTYTNADFAVVGRVLGKAALGAYTLGWTIATIPVERVSALVGRVTPAIFATVQDDPRALTRYLRHLTEGLALITFPATAGLALLADEFVLVALGETWRPAIMPLRLLAVYGGFRCITTLFPQILVATNRTKRNMQFNLLAAVLLPILFYIGSHWGTAGVAAGWIVGYPIVVVPLFIRETFRALDMSAAEYLKALWPATAGTLVMAAVVLALRMLNPPTWPLGLRFAIEVSAGVVTYGLFVYRVHGDRARAFLGMLRNVPG